jgi:hypothetical protein
MLQSIPSYTGIARLDNPQHLRTRSYNLFIQDTLRLRPNLTLLLGLRYEYNTPAVDPNDRATLYDAASGSIVPVGVNGVPRAGYFADKNNLGPRIGIAWVPDAERKWALRSGYGVYFDQAPLAPSQGLYFSPPYFRSQIFIPSQQFPIFLENPFPANYPGFVRTERSRFSATCARRTCSTGTSICKERCGPRPSSKRPTLDQKVRS